MDAKLIRLVDDGGFVVDNAAFNLQASDGGASRGIGSVEELLISLREIKGSSEREIWFRGHRKWSWRLEPTFYRDTESFETVSNPGVSPAIQIPKHDLGDLDKMLNLVKQVLGSHGQTDVKDSDALLLAQHYGVSTPLLDWSTSPLVASWFAIQNAKLLDPNDPPTLWLIDPQFANASVPYIFPEHLAEQPGIEFDRMVMHLQTRRMKLIDSRIAQDFPLAVYTQNDFTTRIGRQSGKFTFSGPERTFRNVVTGGVTSGLRGERAFAPLVFDVSRARTLLHELRLLGIDERTVYGPMRLDESLKRAFTASGLHPSGKPSTTPIP